MLFMLFLSSIALCISVILTEFTLFRVFSPILDLDWRLFDRVFFLLVVVNMLMKVVEIVVFRVKKVGLFAVRITTVFHWYCMQRAASDIFSLPMDQVHSFFAAKGCFIAGYRF
jgi:hypothetical protein